MTDVSIEIIYSNAMKEVEWVSLIGIHMNSWNDKRISYWIEKCKCISISSVCDLIE